MGGREFPKPILVKGGWMKRLLCIGMCVLGFMSSAWAEPMVGPYAMFVDLRPGDKAPEVLRLLQEVAEQNGCQLLTQKGAAWVNVECPNGAGFSAQAFSPRQQISLTCTHLRGGNAKDVCEGLAAAYATSARARHP